MRNPQPKKPAQKAPVQGKSVANEKMAKGLQDNGPTRTTRRGVALQGRGRLPGTVQPRRINRVRAG